MPEATSHHYANRKVLVTGGLGFIGATLAMRLVDLGAEVTIVDALVEGHGGNRFNIAGYEQRLELLVADLAHAQLVQPLVARSEIIFNLAGQISHIDSMRDPLTDLKINCASQLALLEMCRAASGRARIVFASTRQVYGRPQRMPVDEAHALNPVDINGVNKAAAEAYHRLYADLYALPCSILRLSNVYGPRQLICHNRQGFIGWFIRTVLEGGTIEIFGDGSQTRDLVHVDDAVDAFLLAGANEACDGETFNVGGSQSISHRDLSALLIRLAASGSVRLADWPADRRQIDIGSYLTDTAKFRAATGWAAKIDLEAGLAGTLDYYRQNWRYYV